MRFSSALVAASSVLGASAFLVTPDIPNVEDMKADFFRMLNQQHDVDVACPSCPYLVPTPTGDNTMFMKSAYGDKIHLEFTTDDNGVQMNGFTIYPLERTTPGLRAHQVAIPGLPAPAELSIDYSLQITKQMDEQMPRPRIGTTKHGKLFEGYQSHELVSLEFSILTINGLGFRIQPAHVDVVRDHAGRYTIVKAEAVDVDFSKQDPCEGKSDYSFCRLKSIIVDRVNAMLEEAKGRSSEMKEWVKAHGASPQPSHKKGPCHGKPKGSPFTFGHPNHKGQSQPARPAHGHGRGHGRGQRSRLHRVAHFIHRMVRKFVMPAILGVAAGLTASALGMLVGQLIVYSWCRLVRGGKRGPIENVRVLEVGIVDGEKDGLLVVEELPAYTDVEAQEVEVKEDKE